MSRSPPGGPGRSASTGCGATGGFAVGAVLAGVVADTFGILAAIWVVAALTAAAGLVVVARMYETRPVRQADAVGGTD